MAWIVEGCYAGRKILQLNLLRRPFVATGCCCSNRPQHAMQEATTLQKLQCPRSGVSMRELFIPRKQCVYGYDRSTTFPCTVVQQPCNVFITLFLYIFSRASATIVLHDEAGESQAAVVKPSVLKPPSAAPKTLRPHHCRVKLRNHTCHGFGDQNP